MEKILVVTSETGIDHNLIKLLNALFPECEICIVSLNSDHFEKSPNDSSPGGSKTDTRGGSDGKHFDRR